MTDLKYAECGCTIPPDATRCPNYGHNYDAEPAKTLAKSNGNSITVSVVG